MNEDILKEEIAMLESNNRSLQQYKNNWNELKKYLKECLIGTNIIYIEDLLKIMQEIESRK